jgi:hypothetical protein
MMAGSSSRLSIAASIAPVVAFGVPAGASRPNHEVNSPTDFAATLAGIIWM